VTDRARRIAEEAARARAAGEPHTSIRSLLAAVDAADDDDACWLCGAAGALLPGESVCGRCEREPWHRDIL